jgi:DNA (cytosine-5)-methyltransferase 1
MGKLRVLDLFAGLGGFSLGLERTGGFTTAAFCEREPYPRKILAQWWPEVPIYDDVCTLTGERLAADGIAVDVITGGFPCQDISFAGKGAGLAGERSGLFYEVARLIGELEPRFVILENVSALLSRGLDAVLGTLASLGYDAEWHCIPASYLGAPHDRDRIWIVAHAVGCEWREEPYRRALGRMGRQQQSFPWDRDWQSALREFRGMDDGSAYRVDRVDTIRNAVVPQIVEAIGRAILASLTDRAASPRREGLDPSSSPVKPHHVPAHLHEAADSTAPATYAPQSDDVCRDGTCITHNLSGATTHV